MARIVLITNAWGPKHGGINSFNTDFAKALSSVLAPPTRVTCVVLDATPEEVEDAAKNDVKLLSLGIKGAERVDESRALNVLDAVQRDATDEVIWWIGHDVISGGAAVALPKKAGQGRSALIHHMNYVAYTAYKQGKAVIAKKKEEEQRALFRQADQVFAVGPLLRDSLSDLLEGSRQVRMIVPGLAEIVPVPLGKTFSGITYGRLDPENDRIKQGRLAIAGFAAACRKAEANPREPKALRDKPLLQVIGISPASDEEKQLRALAKEKAGQVMKLLALPYEEDRTHLFDELKRSSMAMMLSWHEGFGLTGWEAIAAEVPLIVSKDSGLYKLIDEELGAPGIACLMPVSVRGGLGDLADGTEENFDPADEETVSQAILNLAHDLERRKGYAKTLRTLLLEKSTGYTWANCARSFSDALGLQHQPQSPTPSRAAALDVSLPASPVPVPPAVVEGGAAPPEQPLLELKDPSWDPEWGHAESQLLRAEEACVPFHESRRKLLNEVLTWATEPAGLPAAVQFRIGSAGAGKTRLMIETCRQLLGQDWKAGFLTSSRGPLSEHTLKQFLGQHQRAFVVVDYAETRQRDVVELIRAAFTGDKSHQVRIMLLARDAGEWWDRLTIDYPTIEPFLTGRAMSGPYRIPEIPLGEQNREIIFREALAAFAKRLKKNPAGIHPRDLSAPHFANVLFIHLAAMAALSGERPETATTLMEATLRRERRYWHEAARAQELERSLYPGVDQAVAMLTLRGGAKDAADARRVLESVPVLRCAGQDVFNRVLEVLSAFYMVSGRIDALRPDILGERLISQELAKAPALVDAVLGQEANEAAIRSALVVLNRLARQSSSDVIWLQRGLRQHLSLRTGAAAVAVAIESGDPIGKVLAETLERASDTETYDLIEPLWKKMPEETTALRECALVLAQLRLKRLEKKIKGHPVGAHQKARLAEALLSVANRFAALDEPQRALELNKKALPLYENLAKTGAQQAANYATCLMNTGNCLKHLGKYTEALKMLEEAVKRFRELVRSNPRSFQERLALASYNLGGLQQQLGDFEGSHQSAEMSWKIYQARDPERFKEMIALSRQGLAIALAQLGRYEEAMNHSQQSVKVWEELAEKNPDAFLPNLADAWLLLAHNWDVKGHYKQARDVGEQAVALFQALAAARPEFFRARLGQSLGELGDTLSRVGEWENALKLANQSLEIMKQPMNTDAATRLRRLAGQRFSVASALAGLGRYSEALPHVDAGLSEFLTLFDERPEVFRSSLVGAYTIKAHILILLGRTADALALLLAGKPVFEGLGKGVMARAALSVRADFMVMLSRAQFALSVNQGALEIARLATELYEERLREHPLARRGEACSAWSARAVCEMALGERENAQRSAVRGLELLQADLEEMPRQLSPWMRDVARDLVRCAGRLASEATYAAVYMAIR